MFPCFQALVIYQRVRIRFNRLLKKSFHGLLDGSFQLPKFAPGKLVNVACPSLMKDTGCDFRCAPEIKHLELACHLEKTWAGPSVARH